MQNSNVSEKQNLEAASNSNNGIAAPGGLPYPSQPAAGSIGPYPQEPPPNYFQATGPPAGPEPIAVPIFTQPTGGIPPPGVGFNSAHCTTTTVTQAVVLGSNPCRLICPNCHADVTTAVRREPGCRAHVCALILCCFVCWPLAWLPYCMDSCQDVSHECPNCNEHLGTYQG